MRRDSFVWDDGTLDSALFLLARLATRLTPSPCWMPCSVTLVAQPRRVDVAGLGAWLRPPCPTAVWPLRCQWAKSALGVSLRETLPDHPLWHRRSDEIATTYFSRTTYKSGGALAAGRVQYITRTGPYQSHAEARVLHQGLEAGTDHLREDLVYWRARNLPDWAGEDAALFFRMAEMHERANGVAYTEWRFSLPRELARRQQMELSV